MTRNLLIALSLSSVVLAAPGVAIAGSPLDDEGEPASCPGKVSSWRGYTPPPHDWELDGVRAIIVEPRAAAPGRPWIWRGRFFGHEPQADLALLERGFHLGYCDVAGLYGSPTAVERWNRFFAYATGKLGLERVVALEGMSRGGLIVYNWAAENPDKVSAIYADAPVCDFKSWPGGLGAGKGSPRDWKACLAAYGLDERGAASYDRQPIDRLEPLAKAGVPLLHVVGAADEVVPVGENTAIVEKRYRELGGEIRVISKPGVGHHPHSLADPAPIVEHVRRGLELARQRRSIAMRGSYANSLHRFRDEKKGHVAFMGGSITEMNGYRPMVERWLRKRFPETEFTMTNAGVASTCSTTGAFRLAADVLSKGPVDLFFVEFAVNDDQDAGHTERECVRGMEGIVRHLRRESPYADIVNVHFVNPTILKATQAGKTPLTAGAHERVAERYGISTIHVARELARRIALRAMTWKEYGGTHPHEPGNRLSADMIADLLRRAWAGRVGPRAPHALPAALDAHSYTRGRFAPFSAVDIRSGWKLGRPDWRRVPGGKRERFLDAELLWTEEPGAEFDLEFRGNAIGVYVLAGPDAGALEVRIDAGAVERRTLYHRYSRGLNYPRTVMLATDLAPGRHRVRVRSAADGNRHAVRIVRLVVNDSDT